MGGAQRYPSFFLEYALGIAALRPSYDWKCNLNIDRVAGMSP